MRLFRHTPTIDLAATASLRPASRKLRLAGAFLTLFGALICSYCAAVVATSLQPIVLPGNPITLPGITLGLPGIDLKVEVPLDQLPIPEVDDVPVVSTLGGSGGRSERDAREPVINILVMGTDHTLDFGLEGEPGRTDTLFILSIDPEAKTASILNFPRDTWLNVPARDGGWTLDRINTAYGRGVLANGGDREAGSEYVIRTIEHNFGIPIKYWVSVDWKGFTRIVDSVGGILVRVDDDLFDPISHVLEPFGGRLERGWHLFDGEQALAYSRYRADSDLKRIERQHQVIFALLDRLNLEQVLSDPIGLWDEYRDAITTNVNTVQIPGLALLARQVGRDRIRAYSLGPAADDYVSPGGGAVLVLDQVVASKIMHQALPAVFKGGVSVSILNAAGRPDWATRARDYMVANGAPEFFLRADDTPLRRTSEKTMILNYTGDPAVALALAHALRLPDDRIVIANALLGEFRDAPTTDIVVVAGDDLPLSEHGGASGG